MISLVNRREWYTLKNNKNENEVMILMSLHYDFKDELHHLSNISYQQPQNKSMIDSIIRKSSSKDDLTIEKLHIVNNLNSNKKNNVNTTDTDICII